MQLRPFGSRILIRKHSDEATSGGIIIPEYVKKASLRGTVVEVGPECIKTEVGDDIFFGTYAPVSIPTKYYQDLRDSLHTDDVSEYFVMNEEDIICHIIKED